MSLSAHDDLPALVFADSDVSIDDDVMAMGRGTSAHGACVVAREQAGVLHLSVLLRPRVPMQLLVGLPVICALGVLEALRDLGAEEALIGWPSDLVVPDPEDASSLHGLAGVRVKAGTGETGVFAVCGLHVNLTDPTSPDGSTPACAPVAPDRLPTLAPIYLDRAIADGTTPMSPSDLIASALRGSVVACCDAWADDLSKVSSVAGPLVPVLSDYVDALALTDQPVRALASDGRELARGILCGMDVWGRATVRDAFGREHEFAAEQARLVGLPRS